MRQTAKWNCQLVIECDSSDWTGLSTGRDTIQRNARGKEKRSKNENRGRERMMNAHFYAHRSTNRSSLIINSDCDRSLFAINANTSAFSFLYSFVLRSSFDVANISSPNGRRRENILRRSINLTRQQCLHWQFADDVIISYFSNCSSIRLAVAISTTFRCVNRKKLKLKTLIAFDILHFFDSPFSSQSIQVAFMCAHRPIKTKQQQQQKLTQNRKSRSSRQSKLSETAFGPNQNNKNGFSSFATIADRWMVSFKTIKVNHCRTIEANHRHLVGRISLFSFMNAWRQQMLSFRTRAIPTFDLLLFSLCILFAQ